MHLPCTPPAPYPGTPLHPIISERGHVSALGLFDRIVNGKFTLTPNQMNTFEFDTSRSGEGSTLLFI